MFFMIQGAMVVVMPSSPEKDRCEEGFEERLRRGQTPKNGRLSILKTFSALWIGVVMGPLEHDIFRAR